MTGPQAPQQKIKEPRGRTERTGRIEAHTRSQRIEHSGPAPTEKLGAAFKAPFPAALSALANRAAPLARR